MDIGIQRQTDFLALGGRNVTFRVHLDHTAPGVDLGFGRAGAAAQRLVESAFYPLASNAKSRIEQHRIRVGSCRRQISVVHLGHIADHMREGPAVGINTHLAHVGGNAGQFGRAHIDA